MKLRPYQQRTVDDFLLPEYMPTCVVAPTGSGKTVIGMAIASLYGRICWVCHRQELVSQAKETWRRTPRADLPVAFDIHTIQSIRSQLEQEFDLLVLDECHHYSADDWSLVLNKVKHTHRIGLTATPERADGKGLQNAFDRIIVAANYSELLAQGLLAPCKITAGPDSERGLACDPLKAWIEHGEGRKTIAFAPTVELGLSWMSQFTRAGIAADIVTGETPAIQREAMLAEFRRGELRVLWNVYVLTEGFDVPDVECVMLARKLGHAGQYLQTVGRGLRPSPGKDYLRVIDLAGNYLLHGLPTDDRTYSLTGKAIRRMKVQKLRQCSCCGSVCRAWVGKCPECGFVAPAREIPFKIRNEELEEVFDGENTPHDAKEDELSRLRAIQLDKGYNIMWVVKEYRKLFGRNPVLRDATTEEVHDHYAALMRRGKFPTWLCKKMCVTLFGRAP